MYKRQVAAVARATKNDSHQVVVGARRVGVSVFCVRRGKTRGCNTLDLCGDLKSTEGTWTTVQTHGAITGPIRALALMLMLDVDGFWYAVQTRV